MSLAWSGHFVQDITHTFIISQPIDSSIHIIISLLSLFLLESLSLAFSL